MAAVWRKRQLFATEHHKNKKIRYTQIYMARVRRHLRDHFIPHHGNGHHPHVLRHHVLVGYSALLVLVKAIGLTAAVILPSLQASASAITADRIIALTNATRQGIGLPTLKANEQLMQAARAKAEDMAVNQYFAHTSPAGLTPWHWIKSYGYKYKTSAENLAVHFNEAEDVQNGWMQSPSHHQNIIDPRFSEIGVGIATADFEGAASTFVVEMFGQPKAAVTPPVVTQTQDAPQDVPATVTPTKEGYNVELTSTNAARVTAKLGTTDVPLKKDPAKPSTWVGTVPAQPVAKPTPVVVTVEDTEGHEDKSIVAVVAPQAHLEQAFNASYDTNAEPKVLGSLNMPQLVQLTRLFFIMFIIFLVTALTIAFGYRLHLRNAPAMAHTAIVLALAVFLYALS
jgi:hypothetical protein